RHRDLAAEHRVVVPAFGPLLVENAVSRLAPAPGVVLEGGDQVNAVFSRIEERLDFVTGIAFVDADGIVRVASREAGGFAVGRSVAGREFFRSTITMPLGGTFVGDGQGSTEDENAHFVVSGPIYATSRTRDDGPFGVIALRIDPGYLDSVVYRSEYANAFEVLLLDGSERVLSQYPHVPDAVGTRCPVCVSDHTVLIRDNPAVIMALRYDESRLPQLLTPWQLATLILIGLFTVIVVLLESFLWRSIVRANESQRAVLEDRMLLLREIHHRVYNNLQVLSSLLNIQVADNPGAGAGLESAAGRIHSMASVHRLLYESKSFDRIDFTSFLRDVITETVQRVPDGVELRTQGLDGSFSIAIDRAIPLGLIAHEILTNAAVHAFPLKEGKPPEDATIDVIFKVLDEDDVGLLVVSDNGCGLTPSVEVQQDSHRSHGLGLELVESLAEQAAARLELKPGPDKRGLEWIVVIESKTGY
ncbi:MAG: hypothetical protein EA428_06590, partial [Spirochaetaceae bacterium]